mgnify:FL=1
MSTAMPLIVPDFDTIKAAFIQYLSEQQEFADFNFDGSAFNVLLDVLSQNTHYLALLLCQTANESFLSTAFKRSSIVKIAKSLGYIPKTPNSAYATIQLEFFKNNFNDIFSTINLPGVTVNANFFNKIFIFSTDDTIQIKQIGDRYISKEFLVYEGKRFSITTNVTNTILSNGYVLPNKNVDINRANVYITENSVTRKYTIYKDILDLSKDSEVFFYYENGDGNIVIEFGDNVLGKTPDLNAALVIEYFTTSGTLANGIDSFTITNLPTLGGSITVGVVNASSGGGDAETIESIRTLAPLAFTTQNRAVTPLDYKYILTSKYPNIADVVVYGGETLDPPKYGRVIIAIKLNSGLYLTSYNKSDIANFIKNYNVTTVIPLIIDPNYTYINLTVNILYNPSKLTNSLESFNTKVIDAVWAFEQQYLSGFDRDFYYSTFSRVIDVVDKSIVSNNTIIKLEKKLTPSTNTKTFIETTFNNPIRKYSVISTVFTYAGKSNCFIDDSTGTLVVYKYINGIKSVINNSIGNVEYSLGNISIPTIYFDSLDDDNNINTQTNERYFSIYANTENNDVIVDRDNIAVFNSIDVNFLPI